MERWEIPSCSICYERLLTKLSLLPNCGHIYHDNCLNLWLGKIKSNKLSCPLCRTYVNYKNIISLNYTISKIEDSNDIFSTDHVYSTDEKPKQYIHDFETVKSYQNEINDLKSRLSSSSKDHLDDLQRIHTLENLNTELENKLKNETSLKESIIKENRHLKLSHEKDKATNSALISRLDTVKNDLEKFKHISRYLEDPNIVEIQDIANFLENMTSEDKIKFLMNRVVDLQGIVNELKDANESVLMERDKIDKLYKNLKMYVNTRDSNSYFSAIKESINPRKQSQHPDKPQLPGIENEDFTDAIYDKRKLMDKILTKPKDELTQITSTPNRTKTPTLKVTLSSPDKSMSVNAVSTSDMLSTNIDSKNVALQKIIKKMKTMHNGGTPPPRYNGPTSVKSHKTPERPFIVKSVRNGTTPDRLSTKTESEYASPFTASKSKVVRKVKHNTDPVRNEKAFTIQNFFKQSKDNVL